MTVTARRTTPLITQMNSEWAEIADRSHEFGSLGFRTPGELLSEIEASTGSAQDELLYELLCLARDGHAAAERTVLQALIPATRRMAHRVRGLEDFERTDRIGYAIGVAWESIRAFRLHLHNRVMANLTMTMLGLLTPDRWGVNQRIAASTITVDDETLERAAGVCSLDFTPAGELAELFTWAVNTNVVTPAEVSLLSRVALGDEEPAAIAADLDLTREGLRSKVKRIRKRLTTAVQYNYSAA